MGEPARILQGPWLKAPTLATRTADVFSRVLPEQWAGYAPRDGQLTLTRAIADTLSHGGQPLLSAVLGGGRPERSLPAVERPGLSPTPLLHPRKVHPR